MKQEIDKVFFQATHTQMITQIYQKQLILNKLQTDLINKFEGKIKSPTEHLYIIKNCRSSVDTIDKIFKDMKDYYISLKMPDMYVLNDSIFRILIFNLKKISESYLEKFSQKGKNEEILYKQKLSQNLQQKDQFLYQLGLKQDERNLQNKIKQNAKNLQHLDFFIDEIQIKQAQIRDRMNFIINDIQTEKNKIKKINPKSHRIVFQEIQKQFSQISKKSQHLFNNFFQQVFDQENKTNFLRPQQFQQEVFLQFKRDLSNTIKKKINKIMQTLNILFKTKFKQAMNQIDIKIQQELFLKQYQFYHKNQKSRRSSKQNNHQKDARQIKLLRMKTSMANRKSSFAQLLHEQEQFIQKQAKIQQNKLINEQINQQLKTQLDIQKKQKSKLESEIQILKQNIKKQIAEKKKSLNEYKQLQNLFRRRTYELQQFKAEVTWAAKKTKRQSLVQNQKKQTQQKSNNQTSKKYQSKSMIQKQTQTDFSSNNIKDICPQTIVYQHKSFVAMRSKPKKLGSTLIQQKGRHILLQNQIRLKQIIQKISQILYEKSNEDNIIQQKQQIQILIKQQKYQQIIQRIKNRLNQFYDQAIEINQLQQNTVDIIKNKQTNNKKSKKKTNKSSNIKKIAQFVQFGVQTDNIKTLYQNSSNIGKNKYLDMRNKKILQNQNNGQLIQNSEKYQKCYQKNKKLRRKQSSNSEKSSPIQSPFYKTCQDSKNLSTQSNSLLSRFFTPNFIMQQSQNYNFSQTSTSHKKKRISYLENTFFEQLNFQNTFSNSNHKLIYQNLIKTDKNQNSNKITKQNYQQNSKLNVNNISEANRMEQNNKIKLTERYKITEQDQNTNNQRCGLLDIKPKKLTANQIGSKKNLQVPDKMQNNKLFFLNIKCSQNCNKIGCQDCKQNINQKYTSQY